MSGQRWGLGSVRSVTLVERLERLLVEGVCRRNIHGDRGIKFRSVHDKVRKMGRGGKGPIWKE